ncbi:extracellular solute-binding protein [Salinibacterium sp. G-O1]|uniref:extracellular solute-binding protein n=1 Tax=Salinibacterium sp. G-O1 TaxID=3046208 RepID=UPI0024BB40EF|nr:extracellular solute-binding protein [Salinibacterium sp. G-O1]MDJ0334064.1 extracellular solute-binding protein [Salinibacterium sp. G-O1]
MTGTLRVLIPSFPASNEGTAAWDAVVATFNEEYPGVTVEPDFATFGNLNEKISTSLAGGKPYDILVTGVGWVPPFASQGAYLDLEQFGVTDKSLSEDAVPAIVPAVTYEGAVYAYPLIMGAKPMAYSRAAFEAAGLDPDSPPSTLAELTAAAEKLTVQDDSGKITRAGFDFWAAASNYRQAYVSVLGALGRDLYEDGEPGFDGAEGAEALDWMSDMINVSKVEEFGQKSASGAPLLLTGEAAIGFTGGYIDCAAVTQELCDDLEFFNLEDSDQAMFSGGQVASIGAGSKLADAAWGFIQALATPEAVASMSELNFAVPAASGAGDSEIVQSNPASAFVYDNLQFVVFEGGAANWLDLRDSFNTELDKALLGQGSSADILKGLAEKSK